MFETVPSAVGPYQILERIESGRLAGICRAQHEKLRFPVCLKLLAADSGSPDVAEQLERFQTEARVSAQVDHPHVVRTYQIGHVGGTYFMAFEDLRGQTLEEALQAGGPRIEDSPLYAERIAANGKLPTHAEEVSRLIREAALGLGHLHEQGIVHRDVRPRNIWITADGHAKIMDFGLSRDELSYLDLEGADERATSASGFLGTTAYLSLEQALDSQAATPASDIYSLGCTFYHALTGRVPFDAATPAKQMLLHASRAAIAPSDVNPEIPKGIDEVVSGMMAKLPEERYMACAAVAGAIEPFIEPAAFAPLEMAEPPQWQEFMQFIDQNPLYSHPAGETPLEEDETAAVKRHVPKVPTWRLGAVRAKKILFPTDFSQLSDAAFVQAQSLARDSQAALVVVHVEEPPSAYGGGEMYYGVPEPDNHALNQMLKKIAPDDPSVPCEHHLLIGNPADEIVRLAKEEGVDLIVMATHGRTGLSRLLIGSTAEAVVRSAPCAVLTVKMPHD